MRVQRWGRRDLGEVDSCGERLGEAWCKNRRHPEVSGLVRMPTRCAEEQILKVVENDRPCEQEYDIDVSMFSPSPSLSFSL